MPGEHYEIRHELTEYQQIFIQQVAEKLDISYNAAYRKVWTDAFNLLMQQADVKRTYADLPAVKRC